jgi:hypothetical protein
MIHMCLQNRLLTYKTTLYLQNTMTIKHNEDILQFRQLIPLSKLQLTDKELPLINLIPINHYNTSS